MNRYIYLALIVSMMGMVCERGVQAQGKNILFLHFEQKHYLASDLPADDILSVSYRLQSPKPSRFHGFQVSMVFQTSKITFTPSGDSRVIFDGSVAGGDGLHQGTYNPNTGELTVQALSSGGGYDTSNHLLFSYRVLVSKALADSAMILISRVDAGASSDPSVDSHIDTVIVDGAEGNPLLGWGPIAVAYLDTIPIVHPKKFALTIQYDSVVIASDSSLTIPLFLSGGDSANVKSGSFRFTFDTSILALKGILKGTLLDSITGFVNLSHEDTAMVSFSSGSNLANYGSLLSLQFLAKHRTDTACTVLYDPILQVTNADRLDSVINYQLASICVEGVPAVDTSAVENALILEAPIWRIQNAGGRVYLERSIGNAGASFKCNIYTVEGVKVFNSIITTRILEFPDNLQNGIYIATFENVSDHGIQTIKFSVVH